MSTVKILDLPHITSLQPNTANTVLVGADIPGDFTGQMTLTTLAQGLYSHNYLVVGDYDDVYPNAIATFAGGSNNYVQTIIENTQDAGSADFVAQANVSTDTAYFVDVGFTGDTYNNTSPYNSLGTSVQQLDGYLYVQGLEGSKGGNLIVGTASSNTKINFIVGGVNAENVVAYMTTSGIYSPSINSLVAANVSTLRGEVTANAASANSVINTRITANVATLRSEITANADSANSVINTRISANIATANLFTQSAFDKANNALANTTGTFNGSLTVTGSISTGNVTINNGVSLNDAGLFQYTTANNTTVTQATSKSTAVTCNGRTGQITTNNASLAKGAAVSFTVNNSQVVSNKDVIVVNIASGGSLSSYSICVDSVSAGSFSISITNNGTGPLAEALVINYAILRVN